MSAKVKIQISSKVYTSTFLHVHPQMTARQLSQFICASTLLHRQKGDSVGDQPITIVSKQKNLLIDYLLSSTQTSITRINSLVDSMAKHSKLDGQYIIQLGQSADRNVKHLKEDSLDIQVMYKDQGSLFAYKIEDARKSLLSDDQGYSISREILFKEEIASFVEKRQIKKDVVKSYDEMERIIMMKERLIKLSTHHVNIFGELLSTSMSKETFVFNFKYFPSVPIKDILLLDLNQNQSRFLIDQIWLFFNCLQANGFGKILSDFLARDKVKELIEKLEYEIDGNIFIADLSLVLKENKNYEKLTKAKEQKAFSEVQRYVQSSRIYVPLETQLWPKQEGKEKIDFYQFYWSFNKRKHTYQKIQAENYQPQMNIFEWTKLTTDDKWIDMFEASTAKKPQKNISMRRSKTRKERRDPMLIINKAKTKIKEKRKEKDLSFFR